MSFVSFCAANVLIDCESFYNLVRLRYPVHALLHTYVGATLVIGAIIALFLGARRLESRVALSNLVRWRQVSLGQVALGAALGAYSHVVLDSVMHGDMQPLAPFASTNALLGVVSLRTLHLSCLVLGALGLVGVAVRRFAAKERDAG